MDVDRMQPSQVASVLGFDQQDAVRAVPFEDAPVKRKPRAKRRADAKKKRGPQLRRAAVR